MTNFLDKLAAQIFEEDDYTKLSHLVFESYLSTFDTIAKKLERTDVKKLLFAVQVFQKSSLLELQNEGVIILSMLLDLCAKDYPDLIPIAKNIFIESGDFPNIKLLIDRYKNIDFEANFITEAQYDFREELNTISELPLPLTNYQRELWQLLVSEQDVITSAPTSAGKTFIILNYLVNELSMKNESFAAVIVPTRALISEVSGNIHEILQAKNLEDDISICTVPSSELFADKTIFVMTQERLHEILLSGDISFDYLFIDEAHNITDKSRGVLLHLTIEKLLENSNPQIVISMPSKSYQNSFSSIFKGLEFKKLITPKSPVAKIIMSVELKGRNLVVSRLNSDHSQTISKGFSGNRLADIVVKLGAGQSNIIYQNKTHLCENLAKNISDLLDVPKQHKLLEEAADYVEKFLHEDFSLAGNLRKGVAFHYGPLPSSIRIMVENLAREEIVRFIVCTSTLAEGVNLPAKNVFLKNPSQTIPMQKSERIENVKMQNITGRAGRMTQHFSGNIFLIQPTKWTFKDYFDPATETEDEIPTYFNTLNNEFQLVIDAINGIHPHEESDQYRLYTIANKLIREYSKGTLANTMDALEITLGEDKKHQLQQSIEKAYNKLRVAEFTLEANPNVGYIQQNRLNDFLNEQDVFEEWVLPHPKAVNLYETILRISTKLQEFGIFIPDRNYTLEYICLIARKWIQGNSLKSMISEQITWSVRSAEIENKDPDSINTNVRKVIKVVNTDIRFRLSNALKCYQFLLDNVLTAKKIKLPNVKLHTYIELGACEERVIKLLSIGLTREAALDVDNYLPNNDASITSSELLQLLADGRLEGIHPITKKQLTALFS